MSGGAFVASARWKIYHPSADRWSPGVAVLRALYQAGAVDLGGPSISCIAAKMIVLKILDDCDLRAVTYPPIATATS